MDPTESLLQIILGLDMLRDDDDTRNVTVQDLRDLADWIEKGGFPPAVLTAVHKARGELLRG